MRRSLILAAVVAFAGALAVTQNPMTQGYYFTDPGGNNATAGIVYDRDASDNERLSFQFTTSDTTAFTMGATSEAVEIGTHTVTWAQGGTAADAVDTQFFIADKAYTVSEINVVWGTAESTGAMDVDPERLQGTEACGSGDDLLAAPVDATATANTVTTPTLTSTTANLNLAAGNRLCVDLTATPNEIANLVVTVTLQVN